MALRILSQPQPIADQSEVKKKDTTSHLVPLIANLLNVGEPP